MKQTSREKMMSAALENMAVHGFKGTTTKCIARQAAINEATIFKHFKGKDDLIHEALEQQMIMMKTKIDTFFHADHENIRELLLAKIQFINDIYESHKDFFLVTIKEMGSKELEFMYPSIFEYITEELEKEIATIADDSITEDEIRGIAMIANSVLLTIILEKVKAECYGHPVRLDMKKELLVEMLIRLWGS
ncbi:TetR/AcrR family transcriptional regulator [Paenibacillus sp. MER TA 81-3]|uniref:TetR/AcrR family transcriptional regulator n=1 Tax=Paenibacillus sp. MER TA 81-3 TaxID=2939573 RepID=UPI002041D27C|nr:TetR/AcrR family transcriptional regulator [Paenibacillus sp. MER TA 81-3]MCM3337630.1 TetR/AcrR family transcriptional regulator [Paenibacillus sp. MER TA 81-3]